ncbi:MAG: hypothetical protein O2960_17945 [Verrucomicrobia bacterium]|nr:hypothetical protein [Verrucomicrobiota bacterium]
MFSNYAPIHPETVLNDKSGVAPTAILIVARYGVPTSAGWSQYWEGEAPAESWNPEPGRAALRFEFFRLFSFFSANQPILSGIQGSTGVSPSRRKLKGIANPPFCLAKLIFL